MPAVHRILDANANRAREALRVMEEAARFLLDDAELSRRAKTLRHDLRAALVAVPGIELHRDTPGDVGTAIKTTAEATRADAAAVITAAGKRLTEALRALEEYGKLLPRWSPLPPGAGGGAAPPGEGAAGSPRADFPQQIEHIRYLTYDLEHRLHRALATGVARQWRVCVLLTESLCRLPWREVLRQSVDAGADCVQVREKEMDAAPLLARVCEVVAECRPRGVSVIVNDRPDVALLAGADGVHVGQTDLPVREVRKLVGRQLLVGVSTAKLEHVAAAVAEGADYVGAGPMFATSTKNKTEIVGPTYLRALVRKYPTLPHLAIAGVGVGNVAELVAAGGRGVAVSSAVCGAERPGEVVAALVAAVGRDVKPQA